MAIRNFEAELEKEILSKLKNDAELRRKTKEFAEDVRDTARTIALNDMDKGYATGEFAASIQVERRRNARGQFVAGPAWRVVSRDEKAHFLEYGTGPDAPGTHATWIGLDGQRHWGSNTPTPAYATFAKTALRYGGTSDGALGGSNWIPGADKFGMSSILIRYGERVAATATPIRQYTSRHPGFQDKTEEGKALRKQYLKFLQSDETAGLRKVNEKFNRRRD